MAIFNTPPFNPAGSTEDPRTAAAPGGTFANRSMINRVLIGLGGTDAVARAQQMDAQYDRQQALAQVMQGVNDGTLSRQDALMKYAQLSGDPNAMMQTLGGSTPSAIQEYEYYKSLNPEEQQAYLQTRRGGTKIDQGDKVVMVDSAGNVIGEYGKGLSPNEEPKTKYEQARATEQGKLDAASIADLPTAQAKADYIIQSIDQVLEDPNLDSALGGVFGIKGRMSSVLPLSAEQRGVQPKLDQLRGQVFLQAYEDLKGGGQITEIEGTKAEAAKARLNQAQEPEEYRAALKELRDVVVSARQRITSSAPAANNGAAPTANTGVKTIRFGELPE